MTLNPENRSLGLTTPLGDQELLLTAFRGRESMSSLFEFQLDLISDNNRLEAAQIVGQNITWQVRRDPAEPRYFNAFVGSFRAGDEDRQGRRNYQATAVPWFWFLSLASDCRIFQDQTVPEIFEQVVRGHGFSDYDLSQLRGDHEAREFCVQFRESDFDFLSRLLESEGIFYFFRHENGKHTMVLADNKAAYEDCADSRVRYPFTDEAREAQLTAWNHGWQFHTGRFAQNDYNFETPSTRLLTNETTVVPLPNADRFERYEYPGRYRSSADGQALARIRMEEEETRFEEVQSDSRCPSFAPGGRFTIEEHRSASEVGRKYVITSMEHEAAESTGYETGAEPGFEYANHFTCIPDAVTYRPPRRTPKPRISGTQTAVVVGPAGEEVYTDGYGRVKVQFHWDRQGQRDENSSCWVRVASPWAGDRRGVIYVPLIGDEVVVDFLDGDPDQPIVIGSVYNAEKMPPFELPANKLVTGDKGQTGSNFIKVNNEKGNERIFLHSEKDWKVEVEADEDQLIKGKSKKVVNGSRYDQVNGVYHVHAKKFWVVGSEEIMLTVGGNTIRINSGGITINGNKIESAAAGLHDIKGVPVKINC